MEQHIDRNHIGQSEDWLGNNAAFTCPVCNKVFIVSGLLNPNGRDCPGCGKSTGRVVGGKDSGGTATITF